MSVDVVEGRTASRLGVAESPMLNVREAAQALRLQVWGVYGMIKRGTFPGVKRLGKSYLIPRSDIETLLGQKL